MKNKIFLTTLLIIFLFTTLVSGMQITGGNTFKLNKTPTETQQIIFTLKNNQNFPFYNVSFSDDYEDIVEMKEISVLNPGNSTNITANITAQTDFSGKPTIEGYYVEDLEKSNKTYYIDITDEGISNSNLGLIEGDSVVWHNKNEQKYCLRDKSHSSFASLDTGENYTMEFPSSRVLEYYVSYCEGEGETFPFSEDYVYNRIEVNPTQESISNPNYNAYINLNITMQYPPTEIQADFLNNQYSIDPYSTTEGLFQITNTGNNTAKNIQIQGEWFSFSKNNFNLQPGYTKTISYQLTPELQYTNQTDKDYNKTLEIKGNFQIQSKEFLIHVNYMDLDAQGNFSMSPGDKEFFQNYVKMGCNTFPETDVCRKLAQSYTPGEMSEKEKKANSEAYLKSIAVKVSNMEEKTDYNTEQIEKLSQKNVTEEKINQILEQQEKETQTASDLGALFGVFIGVIVAGGIFFGGWLLWKKHIKSLKFKHW